MNRKCHICNTKFNPDHSESDFICQDCINRQKNGEPPVKYKHLSEWEMRKLVESKKKQNAKKKPVRGGYAVHKCVVCGEEFVATHKLQKICSDECRKEQDRRYWKERYRREKADAKRGQNE
nr:MAG TPA: DNA gyrase subunit A [Caudoviricetes sp.]